MENTSHIVEHMQNKYIDVSQSLSRHCHTNRAGINRAFTTSTLLYSYSRDSVITGKEMLMIHGHNSGFVIPETVSESSAKDLAGEGMAVPCLSSVIWAIHMAKQFPE